jgi:hypothetical protein
MNPKVVTAFFVLLFCALAARADTKKEDLGSIQVLVDKIKSLTHTLDKASKEIADNLAVEEPEDETPPPKKAAPPKREKAETPADKAKRKATLEQLKKFMENLGVDVMKQVNQAVDRLNKQANEIE